MRFLLTYAPEKQNRSYAQFLVDVDDPTRMQELMGEVERGILAIAPDALVYGRRFVMGPGSGGKIQARFSGPDPAKLRMLSADAERVPSGPCCTLAFLVWLPAPENAVLFAWVLPPRVLGQAFPPAACL